MRVRFFFVTLIVLFAFAGLASAQTKPRVVRPEDGKPLDVNDRMRFENAMQGVQRTSFAMGTSRQVSEARQTEPTSYFAMVRTAGDFYDSSRLGITAVVHRTVPALSFIGVRTRRYDGTSVVEGVVMFGDDLTPGTHLMIKEPGGWLFFDTTKQYELVVVDPNTLVTTVDYIPVVTGNGPFIHSAIQIVNSTTITGNRVSLHIYVDSQGETIDGVVIGGIAVPRDLFSMTQGTVEVNLSGLNVCFGGGDVSVTVVKGGQADTTQARFPQGLPQLCN